MGRTSPSAGALSLLCSGEQPGAVSSFRQRNLASMCSNGRLPERSATIGGVRRMTIGRGPLRSPQVDVSVTDTGLRSEYMATRMMRPDAVQFRNITLRGVRPGMEQAAGAGCSVATSRPDGGRGDASVLHFNLGLPAWLGLGPPSSPRLTHRPHALTFATRVLYLYG